jgi:hypothetical protein
VPFPSICPNPHKRFSDSLRRQPSRNHPSGFTVPLPCFFPLCLAGRLEIPSGATKGDQAMGRCQTEIYYPTEASYLKSVLLWLQEYWTGPAVQVRPLKSVPQVSRYYSPRRTYAAPNRRSEIVDLPAFLPPRHSSEYRPRKTVNQGKAK